jgi:hypothetical protein
LKGPVAVVLDEQPSLSSNLLDTSTVEIMGGKAFLMLLCCLDVPMLPGIIGVAETIEPPQPFDPTCEVCGLRMSEEHPHSHAPPPMPVRRLESTKHPMRYLPHTLVTSNLGCWASTYRLHFNHLLAEDPSIAVFSVKQSAPIPSPWHDKHRRIFLFPRKRLSCNAKVVVGSGWQYEVSKKAIRYWDPQDGVMLVDWHILYSSYFAQKDKEKNRKKVGKIVERYRKLEETTLRTETGGAWRWYGDWDIHPATRAEVALVCKYEGRGFEAGLDKKKEMLSAHELKVRLGNLVKVVKRALWTRLERKRSRLWPQIDELESYGNSYGKSFGKPYMKSYGKSYGGCGTMMPGYQRLR